MRIAKKANFEHRFHIVDGSSIRPWPLVDYEQINKNFNLNMDNRRRVKVEELKPFQVEKPDWLKSSERKARTFVRSVGLTAAKGTALYAVGPSDDDEYRSIFGSVDYMAHYDPIMGIVVPVDGFARNLDYEDHGTLGIESILVHELVHAAEPIHPRLARFYDTDRKTFLGYHTRQGLAQKVLQERRGSFFNEGIANTVAGLYVRQQLYGSDETLCSIDEAPAREKPNFYTIGIAPKLSGKEFGSGYDAYSMEMISWGAWQLGITATKDAFLETMLKTFNESPELSLSALREVPQIVGEIDSSLYPALRRIDYDVDEWREAMHTTYETVMRKVTVNGSE